MSATHHQFHSTGFEVVPSVFSPVEIEELREHFMVLRKEERPMDFAGSDLGGNDPLKKYPRMIHMHRWDDVSMSYALDSRLQALLTEILGEEPYMVQTMLYFKPAGARGQALHQDQFYLRAQPGTCIAAWIALDDCDEENGCMQLVPGTHELPILCTIKADSTQSFTDVTVPLPEGMSPVPATMKAGDVLFFNGSVIHGSFPNTSKDRFRRSFICHYVTGNAERVGEFYHPAYRFSGDLIDLETSPEGSRCGAWVNVDGTPDVEMIDSAEHDRLVRHE